MNRLDKWVENTLIPDYTRGEKREAHQEYKRLQGLAQYHRKAGHLERAEELRRQAQQHPSQDPTDPGYRRLRYVRYADDFLLGLAGPKFEAEEIKARLGEFLRDTLKLELSKTKTLITHA